MIRRCHFVQGVPARTNPVAVHAWPSTRARDEASGVDEGMTEAGVVVERVCLDLEELIVGRHSRCEGLLLLALIHLLGTSVSKEQG